MGAAGGPGRAAAAQAPPDPRGPHPQPVRARVPRPTAALAGATAAPSTGVGFLPVLGHQAGLGHLATGAAVSLLAAAAALIQPRAGRAHDTGGLAARTGGPGHGRLRSRPARRRGRHRSGHCADHPARLRGAGCQRARGKARPDDGRAEVGRELGDAGGRLLVGMIAAATLTGSLAALAALLALGPARPSPAATGTTSVPCPDARRVHPEALVSYTPVEVLHACR